MKKVFESFKNWFGKGYHKIIMFEIILLMVLFFNSFVFKIADRYKISLILSPFLVISILIFGYERNNQRNRKDVLINILIFILAYYFISYILGLFVGFLRSSYSLYYIDIIKNTFPVVLLIIISEVLRYVLFTKSKGSTICLVIGYLIFVLIDINTMVHLYNIGSYSGLTKMICLVLFPSMTKNILMIYLTRKVGYTSCIVYRIILEISPYVIPIFPDFGQYIDVVLKTLLPVIITIRLNTMSSYLEERKITSSRYNNKRMIVYSIITFLLFVIVTLTSGYFTYQALSIGSGSMSPKIEKGDVVILKRVKESRMDTVKKGDVLVYYQDKRIIVHRIVKIIKNNNSYNYITKGDNNNARDAWVVKDENVIGVVKFKIKWIGMPTVALNELLNR